MILQFKKPAPGTYRPLHGSPALSDAHDVVRMPGVPEVRRVFSVSTLHTTLEITVSRAQGARDFKVNVLQNGIPEEKWDWLKRTVYLGMLHDRYYQAEINRQAPGRPEYLDAIRQHATNLAASTRVNEAMNFFIPKERVFVEPPRNDPPEIVARRKAGQEWRNRNKRMLMTGEYR